MNPQLEAIAKKIFPDDCQHIETHTEVRYSLASNGTKGELEPAEEWEVTVCSNPDCQKEIKPEIDWSNVMDDLPH